jgi:hypothetical protein
MVMSSKPITASSKPSIKRCVCEARESLPAAPITGTSCAIWFPGATGPGQREGREEQSTLRPLPRLPLVPCKEVQVRVSRFSTIHLGSNVYSVPSRLIGTRLLVRLHAETIEGYVGTKRAFTLPRLIGTHQHRIDYHHFIWSLVRKPGAFAAYRYRDELFPTTTFRLATTNSARTWPGEQMGSTFGCYTWQPARALAEVETALVLLLESKQTPTAEAVRELAQEPASHPIPDLSVPALALDGYDQLIPSRREHA